VCEGVVKFSGQSWINETGFRPLFWICIDVPTQGNEETKQLMRNVSEIITTIYFSIRDTTVCVCIYIYIHTHTHTQ